MAAVTMAAALLEANTRPHLSVDVNITAITVTMVAANVTNDARGGPSPAALDNDADNGGAGNTAVQVAVMSVISNTAKSFLCLYFEGVNWPLNK
jgi:hypothetical protein